MRWVFAETEEELQRRSHLLDQIDEWWTAFRARADEIDQVFSGDADLDLPAWMQENLQAIDQRLMWEFGPAIDREGHRLVITPESEHHLRPLVDALFERAPDLDRWEFYKFRIPEPYERAVAAVQGRTGGDISGWKVRPARDGKEISLTFLVPDLSRAAKDEAMNSAFVAAEAILGEEMLNKWVGVIEVEKLVSRRFFGLGRDAAADAITLDQLRAAAEGVVAEIRTELPNKPQFQLDDPTAEDDGRVGFIYELQPEEADDYPRVEDMFVGKGTLPGFFEAVRSATFWSSAFSDCGETFCYLKFDGKDGINEEKFADKGEIEDAVDDALRAEKCGCFIGGGTGLRYSYVDLALTDVPKAITLVKDVLRRGNIPKRSWVLFYDSDQVAEWVGIYDDTPAPPGISTAA